MSADLFLHYINHIERPSCSSTAFIRLLVYEFISDVNSEKLGTKTSGLHSPEVGVSFCFGSGVIATHPKIESVIQERGSDVVMSINDYWLFMQLRGSCSKRDIVDNSSAKRISAFAGRP